jgi:DNA-binding SARP family transcriptional activator
MAAPNTIELLLFGPPTLRRTDTRQTAKLRPQVKAALAIIVLEGTSMSVSDERLIERLWWPEKLKVRGSLNTLLDDTRAFFEELDPDIQHLERDDRMVRLHAVTVDTWEFDIARNLTEYDRALEIASRGPLLEGLRSRQAESFDWIERARRRYGVHVDWCYQQIIGKLATRVREGEQELLAYLIEVLDRRHRSAIDYDLVGEIDKIRTDLDQLREIAKSEPLVLAPPPSESSLEAQAVTKQPLNRLLLSRLGSGLSLQADPEHLDTAHHYTRVVRHDLLDYASGDFYSLRRLCGVNVASKPSSGLVYVESSETRITFEQTGTRAYDTASQKRLVVEPLLPSNVELYQHAFRILFPRPIAPNEAFDVTYAIRLPGELTVLSPIEEIMSIALVRWPEGVERLEFKVCLNFEPSNVTAEYLDDRGELAQLEAAPMVAPYKPEEWYERDLDIPWSSEPYLISYAVNQPQANLYAIRYRVASDATKGP